MKRGKAYNMPHDEQSADPPLEDSGKTITPGGPLATPETAEGKIAADAEGEEA